MNATIRIPRTSCATLQRRWASDVALEVRDAIRHSGELHALFVKGMHVHYEPVRTQDVMATIGWQLVGVYDDEASVSDIADDLELMTEREPIHAVA